MPNVLDAQFGMISEVTYGTPLTPTRFFELTPGDGFDYRPNRVQGSGLRVGSVGPRSNRRATPNADAGATFNFDVLSKGFGIWWFHAMGITTSTLVSGTTYQQVHTYSALPKPLTAQLGVPRIGADGTATIDPITANGCIVTGFGLTMDAADILKARFDLDARALTTGTALATASYPASPTNLFSFAGAAIYGGSYTAPTTTALASGATPLANVTNFSIDVARNADVSRLTMGNAGLKNIPTIALAAVTGTLGIEYTDTVYRDAYLTDSDLTLVVNFQAGVLSTGLETLQICVPNIRLEGELPKPTGETTKASCNFTGFENLTNPLLQIVCRTADTAI